MKDYKIIGNYIIYNEVCKDAFGVNYKAKKIVNGKPADRKLAVELYDFIGSDAESTKALHQYLAEMKKSSVPNLLIPEAVIESKVQTLLIFPYISGKTLKQVIDKSEKRGGAINFHMTMLIALKIAILIDIGSLVMLNGKPSFHGFLIPENIIIDYNGDIYLKHYGMLPFVNSSVFTRIKSNYRIWLTPELFTNGEILYKSEIYYLGHIVYRILTGKFFPCPPGNDFEAYITNISFTHNIPSTDKSFIVNFIEFFRKTLNPVLDLRFANLNEFTRYISDYFSISDTQILTSDLSEFMKNLFGEDEEGETNPLDIGFEKKKKSSIINEYKEAIDTFAVPEIFEEEEKKSRGKFLLLALVLIIVSGYAIFKFVEKPKDLSVNNQSENKSIKQKSEQDTVKEKKEDKTDIIANAGDYKKSSLEEKKLSVEEKTKEADKIAKDQQAEQKEIPDQAVKKTRALTQEKTKETYQLNEISNKPKKVYGVNPIFSAELGEKYKGKVSTVLLNILINRMGCVDKVEPLSQIPSVLVNKIKTCLGGWRFTPAQKNNIEVKVWMPVSVNIIFKKDTKKEIRVIKKNAEKKEAPLVPLVAASQRPEKISGEDPVFSKAILGSYRGRRATIYTEVLINEFGQVTRVRIKNKLPEDITNSLINSLKKWKYYPAKKGTQLVKVWLPVTLRIHFK